MNAAVTPAPLAGAFAPVAAAVTPVPIMTMTAPTTPTGLSPTGPTDDPNAVSAPYSALPDGQVYIPTAGGLTPPQLIRIQHAKNDKQEREYQESRVQHITLKTAVQNMRDTLEGTIGDLWGNSTPLSFGALMTKDNRLRGLGLLLVLVAAIGLLLDTFLTFYK